MARANWNGLSEQINYFPQDLTQNRSGAWYKMEEEISELKRLNGGSKIRVEIVPVFVGNSKRPSQFRVVATMNGQPIPNSPYNMPNP